MQHKHAVTSKTVKGLHFIHISGKKQVELTGPCQAFVLERAQKEANRLSKGSHQRLIKSPGSVLSTKWKSRGGLATMLI